MKGFRRVLCIACLLLCASEVHASPAEADRIRKAWELSVEKWSLENRLATTPESRAAVIAKRPDPFPTAREMWRQIGDSLDQDWTLEPAAWFLRLTQGLSSANADGIHAAAFATETQAILKALENRHLQSAGLTPMCMALTGLRDPHSLTLLEQIQKTNPDPKLRGVAAMATAMRLRHLGDERDLMRRRLTCLDSAIRLSSEVDVGGATIADLARDELYIIRYLSKGRIAPDLAGTDSAGRPLKLSDFNGRIVMLLFWNSSMPEAERTIEITNGMPLKFQGRAVEVIGVNLDPLEKLRSLEADNTVTWKSLSDPAGQLAKEYRVGSLPLVYVLDGERKIHYAGTPGSFVELTIEALLAETPAAKE